ncbi:hypothetical protein AAVH_38466 [Aphelenchoides avenae]|nr:hypothetical protein AAVH_38466 [Aphelenchus avenae]
MFAVRPTGFFRFLALLMLCTLLAISVFSPTCSAAPTHMDHSDAMRLLKNYMEYLDEPENNGFSEYVVMTDGLRSAKRGLGPRPLRFG